MPPAIPQRLGDYDIVRELGRGGMGVVYEARQRSLNRKVALKVLAAGLGLTARAVERFQREAEAAARLHHTNIVPVYATGEQDGTHFYAMELIEGPSLDHVIRQLRQQTAGPPRPTAPTAGAELAPALAATGPYANGSSLSAAGLASSSLGSGDGYFDQVARSIADVAGALDYAHQQGVLHRDIKPSNLLLAPDGRLSINDFGLARVLEQPGMTMTGDLVGTPAYMSPEQITAGRTPLDHRTDVYSLGATLYELLTLQPPFAGDRREQLLAQILHKEPRPPRKLNRKVPVDLETICLKALDKDPDRRYQTAGALAADLRRYVNRFAITARRAGPFQQLHKWVRRHPGLTTGLACTLLALAAAGYFAWRAHEEGQRREQEVREQGEKLLTEKRQHAIDRALAAATGGDLEAAATAIAAAERLGASPGQVCMLRGQLALHRGQTNEALLRLKEAVELLPESVAARGMLMVAYAYDGQWEEYEQDQEKLAKLSPVTPEDFLFKGYAEGQHDPGRGIQGIEEAIRRRPSMLIAHLLSADLRVWHAQDRGEQEAAEKAVQEAERARQLLPGNPTALWVCLHARVIAAGVYDQLGKRGERRAVLEKARADVDALKAFTAPNARVFLPDAVVYRWLFFREQGNERELGAEVLDELRRASKETDHVYAGFCCALTLFRRGDAGSLREALGVLPKGGRYAECLRPLVLAELAENDKQLEEARQACREFAKGWQKRNGGWGLEAQAVLRLLGDTRGAVTACEELEKHPEWLSVLRREHEQCCVKYCLDKLLPEELERSAKKSRWDRCLAHYYIGMKVLADGKRKTAGEQFAKVMTTRAFCWFAYDLSWVFVDRLKNDPTWPRWIKE